MLLPATYEDAPALRVARVAAFEWEKHTYGFVARGYDTVENMIEMIRNDVVLKIIHNGEIVGGVCIRPKGDGVYSIGPLFVHPRFHNRGIGTYTMKMVEKYLADKKLIELNTAYRNIRNHYFYEKLGYVKVGEFPEGCKGFRLFLYEKRFK